MAAMIFPHPKWPRVTLIVMQVAQLLSLVAWFMIAGASLTTFGAHDSDHMSQPPAFVIVIWSYPVWLLISTTVSWLLFKSRNYLPAVLACFAGFLLPAIVVLTVFFA
jgi:hypothetical protein